MEIINWDGTQIEFFYSFSLTFHFFFHFFFAYFISSAALKKTPENIFHKFVYLLFCFGPLIKLWFDCLFLADLN